MAKRIQLTIAQITLAVMGVFFAAQGYASPDHDNDHGTEEAHQEEKFNAGKMIMHHISDAHEIHVVGDFAIYLPVILWDNGLKVFSSSHFYHGEEKHITSPSGEEMHYYEYGDYVMSHEHIYKKGDSEVFSFSAEKDEAGKVITDEAGNAVFSETPSNEAPLDLSITKSIAGMLLILTLMLILFLSVARKYKKNPNMAPSGSQGLIEPLILFIRDEVAVPSIGAKKAGRYMPFLLTVFFFIWMCNLLGLVPFLGGFNITGTLAITLLLAALVFIITLFSSNKHYWSHILAPTGVPLPIKFILVPIEIASIFIKPAVLMIRLTANITAGHIIILSFVSLIIMFGQSNPGAGYGIGVGSVLFMVFMFFIELLVAFLQAYVFTLLAALYFGEATQEDHAH